MAKQVRIPSAVIWCWACATSEEAESCQICRGSGHLRLSVDPAPRVPTRDETIKSLENEVEVQRSLNIEMKNVMDATFQDHSGSCWTWSQDADEPQSISYKYACPTCKYYTDRWPQISE